MAKEQIKGFGWIAGLVFILVSVTFFSDTWVLDRPDNPGGNTTNMVFGFIFAIVGAALFIYFNLIYGNRNSRKR